MSQKLQGYSDFLTVNKIFLSIALIIRLVEAYNNDETRESNRLIVKAPYSTHGYADTRILQRTKVVDLHEMSAEEVQTVVDNLMRILKSSCKHAAILPYVMVQPLMVNATEKKTVVVNGKAFYIADNFQRNGRKYSSKIFRHTNNEVMTFAEEAVAKLKAARPYAIVDMIVRVDIFENAQGQLIVNEFESFEALYETKSGKLRDIEQKIYVFLQDYWCDIITSKLDKFLRAVDKKNTKIN